MIAAGAKQEFQAQEQEGIREQVSLRVGFRAHTNGANISYVARRLNRSVKTLERWIEGQSNEELDRDIKRYLSRKEDLRYSPSREKCCPTSVANTISECASFADKHGVMVLVTAASGSGKTIKLKKLAEANDEILYTILDIATRSPGMVLKSLACFTGGITYGHSTSELLHLVGERLHKRYKLLLIDDVHFASWQTFEMFRYLHDSSGIGMLLAGQPRTYDVMMGRADKAMLYDQLLSRLAMKRNIRSVTRDDVRLIVEAKVGQIDRASLDFLFQRASGQGRLRTLNNILRIASEGAEEFGSPITLEMLKDAEQYLVF
jgi:DNA transposition AAA+ family ATPase